ncbi:hypothetical protein [Amycolatopsis echigonensis]|uniref:Excreted virulence factor EspC (Type VII ESX diderm) n=1 Tax=Amycolatopsis echigonensis TaxID=2576905 RepID=A0A8E1W0C4_9PSEU|nr:hypothetical protein [Amycolatopsis echigonensis]MBB2501478.1 hypothetical protein [Amycolatopsis echigonensis]
MPDPAGYDPLIADLDAAMAEPNTGPGEDLMGFATVPDALRSAGRAGQTAIGEIRAADCGTPVNGATTALPGAKAAGAAGEFASSWAATLTTWCNDAGEHAAALGKAADTYIAGDDHARDALPGEHKMHGPR